jgi:hypothetical protein
VGSSTWAAPAPASAHVLPIEESVRIFIGLVFCFVPAALQHSHPWHVRGGVKRCLGFDICRSALPQSPTSLPSCSISSTVSIHSGFPHIHSTAQNLVVYVFSHSDPEYDENLLYFLKNGVAEGDGCDYLLVIQEVGERGLLLWLKPLRRAHAWRCPDPPDHPHPPTHTHTHTHTRTTHTSTPCAAGRGHFGRHAPPPPPPQRARGAA